MRQIATTLLCGSCLLALPAVADEFVLAERELDVITAGLTPPDPIPPIPLLVPLPGSPSTSMPSGNEQPPTSDPTDTDPSTALEVLIDTGGIDFTNILSITRSESVSLDGNNASSALIINSLDGEGSLQSFSLKSVKVSSSVNN